MIISYPVVKIVIDTLPDIPTEGLTAEDVPDLTERVRNMMLERLREINKLTDKTEPTSRHVETSSSTP